MKNNWAYYISGRKLALVKQDNTTLEYKSPDEAVTLGYKLEIVTAPSGTMDSADDSIDVNEELALAVVEYVKSKFAENQAQFDKAEYHMKKFKNRVYRYKNKQVGGARMVMTSKPFAIK